VKKKVEKEEIEVKEEKKPRGDMLYKRNLFVFVLLIGAFSLVILNMASYRWNMPSLVQDKNTLLQIIFVLGLAEIIQILHDIRRKLYTTK